MIYDWLGKSTATELDRGKVGVVDIGFHSSEMIEWKNGKANKSKRLWGPLGKGYLDIPDPSKRTMEAKIGIVEHLLERVSQNWGGDFMNDLSKIIITGDGAGPLRAEIIEKFPKEHYHKVVFPLDPGMANVYGFAKALAWRFGRT